MRWRKRQVIDPPSQVVWSEDDLRLIAQNLQVDFDGDPRQVWWHDEIHPPTPWPPRDPS